MIIKRLTDLDKYKIKMMIERYHDENGAVITRWKFTNRSKIEEKDIHLYEEAMKILLKELKDMNGMKFTEEEIEYLSDEKRFGDKLTSSFLMYLKDIFVLDTSVINYKDGELTFEGPWFEVTLFETIILSIFNEVFTGLYAKKYNIDIMANAIDNTNRKVEILNGLDDELAITEFGTRRRASYEIQKMVIEKLMTTKHFKGTSNVSLAMELDIPCIGTVAHEEFMGECAIYDAKGLDIRKGHQDMLVKWDKFWDSKSNVLLSDTFGTDAFFEDIVDTGLVNKPITLRHDSGDPVEFAKKAIRFFEYNDIDPKERTIVFSDGLTVDKCIDLYYELNDKINVSFGVGTSLTNDCGGFPLSIVCKLESVVIEDNRTYTVKLSDNKGKHMGPYDYVEKYKEVFDYVNKEENNTTIVY